MAKKWSKIDDYWLRQDTRWLFSGVMMFVNALFIFFLSRRFPGSHDLFYGIGMFLAMTITIVFIASKKGSQRVDWDKEDIFVQDSPFAPLIIFSVLFLISIVFGFFIYLLYRTADPVLFYIFLSIGVLFFLLSIAFVVVEYRSRALAKKKIIKKKK